jgi:hypothetical protein
MNENNSPEAYVNAPSVPKDNGNDNENQTQEPMVIDGTWRDVEEKSDNVLEDVPQIEPIRIVDGEERLKTVGENPQEAQIISDNKSKRKFVLPLKDGWIEENGKGYRPQLGYEELKRGLGNKKTDDEGNVKIQYISGRNDPNTNKPLYQSEVVMSKEKAEEIEDLIKQEETNTSTDINTTEQTPPQNQAVSNIVRNEGTDKISLNADENSNTYRASSDYNKFSPENTFNPDKKEHKRSKERDTWSIKRGEKPTDVVKKYDASKKHIDIDPTGRKREDSPLTERVTPLDEIDEHGKRVATYRSSYHTAERIKILNSIKEYDKKLNSGRKLTDEEKDLLLDSELSKIKAYQNEKSFYESKNLPKKDIDLLLNNHFKERIDGILDGFKDSNGEFNSSMLDSYQRVLLTDNYKKNLNKEFTEDKLARMDESDERFRDNREEEFRKQFKEEHGFDWTPEWAGANDAARIAREEADLYREQMLQNSENSNNGDENEDSTVPNPTPEETNPEEIEPEETEDTEAQERKIKRNALIAGVAVGGTTAILGGAAVLPVAGGIAAGGGLLSFGTEALSVWRIKKLNEKLNITEDPTEKAQIEKRLANWNKVRKIASTAKSFFTGGGVGLAVGGLFNHFAMGGEGLISKLTADKTGNLVKTPEVTPKSTNPQSVSKTPQQQDITPKPEVTQPEVTTQPELTQINTLDSNTLPDTLSLDEYPLLRQGLGERANFSQDKIDSLKTLFIGEGTPGGDWWTQRRTIEEILKNRLPLNSEAAGKTVAHIAGNKLPVTSENVIKIFNSFAGN